MDDLLTTAQAGAALGITPGRVRHLVLAGRLPARKVGRDLLIRATDLALVAERRPGNHSGRPRGRAAQGD